MSDGARPTSLHLRGLRAERGRELDQARVSRRNDLRDGRGQPGSRRGGANIIHLLRPALEGQRCRVFTSDLRVRVAATGLGTYPDASVICGQVDLDPEDRKVHTARKPVVVVEVLSPSTEDYDRGEKFAHYRRIESLREVMLVAHDERRVDLWRRVGTHWTQLSFRSGESVPLESLDVSLLIDGVYFDPLAP